MAHLLQLLLQAQVVLDLLAGVVVSHARCPQHFLGHAKTHSLQLCDAAELAGTI